jgi:hypothetical protein
MSSPIHYYCRTCKREFGQGTFMPHACTLCKSTNIIGRQK